MAASWTSSVLDFWFALAPEQWWKPDKALDAEIRRLFLPLWSDRRNQPAAAFLAGSDEALAAIILFDQFPRNMFRGLAESFETDPLALVIATGAIERGYDLSFEQPRRGFFYMPFQHSEDREDQRRSVELFTALGDDYQLRFARLHRDVIERFGRFPHRNAILGRTPTPEEAAAGEVVPW